MLTLERVNQLLAYDPLTGVLTWRVSRGKALAGQGAGYLDKDGYLRVKIDEREYKAHRLAWLLVHSTWPGAEVDHRDGNKANNRISNLREASRSENACNRGATSANTSGFVGVTWHKKGDRWQAAIALDRRSLHLGLYNDASIAAMVYDAAARVLHGEFAKLNFDFAISPEALNSMFVDCPQLLSKIESQKKALVVSESFQTSFLASFDEQHYTSNPLNNHELSIQNV